MDLDSSSPSDVLPEKRTSTLDGQTSTLEGRTSMGGVGEEPQVLVVTEPTLAVTAAGTACASPEELPPLPGPGESAADVLAKRPHTGLVNFSSEKFPSSTPSSPLPLERASLLDRARRTSKFPSHLTSLKHPVPDLTHKLPDLAHKQDLPAPGVGKPKLPALKRIMGPPKDSSVPSSPMQPPAGRGLPRAQMAGGLKDTRALSAASTPDEHSLRAFKAPLRASLGTPLNASSSLSTPLGASATITLDASASLVHGLKALESLEASNTRGGGAPEWLRGPNGS